MKVMETVNVVIDKSSDFGSEKGIEKFPKEILPPTLVTRRPHMSYGKKGSQM